MKKKLLLLSLCSLCLLVSCGEGATSINEGETTSIYQGSIEKVEITNKDKINAEIYVGETGQIKATAYPSEITQSFTFESSDPEVIEIKKSGRFVALKEGTSTLTAKCTYNEVTKEDSITITVKDTFFDHSAVFVDEPDWEFELDLNYPHVEYKGSGYLNYKQCYDTSWYAETYICVNEMMYGEVWGKVGLQSCDSGNSQGLFYYIDTPLGNDGSLISSWNQIGRVDQYAGQYQAEFNYELTAKIPQNLIGKSTIAYGDEVKIAMLRDGADYYFYVNDKILDKTTSTMLSANDASLPAFTANNVAVTVSEYSYILSSDPEFESYLSKARAFVKK